MRPLAAPVSALVIDDEATARDRLTELLNKDRDIGSVREADGGTAAIALIREIKPDIVFLDVQMPEVDGFSVINAIGVENMPLTVFVTAYDRFALHAFDADATDYLLKPFSDERFERAMERAKKRLYDRVAGDTADAPVLGPEALKLVAQRSTPGEIWDWIMVKSQDGMRLVKTEEIDWIQATGIYVTLHAGDAEILHRASMASVASRLDPFQFVRVHRSSILNIKSIAVIERRAHGDFDVTLKSGAVVIMSRKYRAQFEAMVGQSL